MAVPEHVGIIMDGNRRLSRRLLRNPLKGHEWGRDKLKEVLDWCRDLGIKELTVYAFSLQNFGRPKEELDHIMNLFREAAEEYFSRREELNKHGISIRFLGRKELLPADVQESVRKLEEVTRHNKPYRMNICMAYGGREELIDAIKDIGTEIESGKLGADQVSAEVIEEHLYMSDEPDMIIRTGGERRTSNFLIWQSWYSEWFFVDTLWPEFSKDEFVQCINEYSERQRRYGK